MPPKNLNSNRPQIWADGRQSPPFDFRAFSRAALLMGREDMSTLLHRCSVSAQGTAAIVATGRWRVPETRWGRTGRYLPSVQQVAGAVAGASGLLGRAARSLEKKADESALSPSLFTVTPKPLDVPPSPPASQGKPAARTAAAPLTPTSEDPDLAAIRALIVDTPPERAQQTTRPQVQSVEMEPQIQSNARSWLQEQLAGFAGTALGYGLLGMALPYGAIKAGLAHLNGEDLRKLEA